MLCATAALAGEAPPPQKLTNTPPSIKPVTPQEYEAKRAWVKEVEDGNYYFWRRWFLYNQTEPGDPFYRPDEWYLPSAVVVGGLRPFFPDAAARERTIDASAFE